LKRAPKTGRGNQDVKEVPSYTKGKRWEKDKEILGPSMGEECLEGGGERKWGEISVLGQGCRRRVKTKENKAESYETTGLIKLMGK